LTARPLASIQFKQKLESLHFNLFMPLVLSRLRRKSVKKTEAVSVKKISLFDDQKEEFGNF